MSQELTEANASKPLIQRLGISGDPSRKAGILRAILKGLREGAAEEIKKLPGGSIASGVIEALLDLSEQEDDEKLERLIEQIFETGEKTYENIEALTALSLLMYSRVDWLVTIFEAEGVLIERQQLTEFAKSSALLAYRTHIASDYQYADYRGIEGVTRYEHAASLPMDDVYIVPQLLPEGDIAGLREREQILLKSLLDYPDDLSPFERIRLEQEFALITGKRFRPLASLSEKEIYEGISLGAALADKRQAVVIGGPGVGKSTMTRFLARTCALGEEAVMAKLGWSEKITPIVLPLATYADAKRTRVDISLRDFLNEKMVERGGEALGAAIGEEMAQGRLLLMMDGVDEVPTTQERSSLTQAVDRFISDHKSNRIIITSRPFGYIRLAGEIPHFQMPNFSPEQVEAFVHNWQRALEIWKHPKIPNFASAEADAKAMVAEIESNDKVSELAANPLMLVIISLIRLERAQLPNQRVQLYYRAVLTLMDTWNYWRSKKEANVGGITLPVEQLIRVWGAIAEWTRRTKPTGVIHREELKRQLVRVLEDKELDDDNAEATAESYLNAATDRAGLLEERGRKIFAFWHPTFEEFLAAVELATPASKAIDRLLPLISDPRWREVILLAVGYIGLIKIEQDTATAIVEAILNCEKGSLEPLLHSNLHLAAQCIADDVGVKRSAARRVVRQLAEVVRRKPYEQFNEAFFRMVRSVSSLRPNSETIVALICLTNHSDTRVRWGVARLLGNVAAENVESRKHCELLLEDSDSGVRKIAALCLARSGDLRPEVWEELLPLMGSEARKIFSDKLDEIAESLFCVLSDDRRHLRINAASLLMDLGRADERVINTLVSLLSSPRNASLISYCAASLLADLGRADERVINTLTSMLLDRFPGNGDAAARLLKKLGRTDEQIADTLIPLLSVDDPEVCYKAARMLKNLGRADEQVINALVSLLSANDLGLRLHTASLLMDLGRTDEQVINTLVSSLSIDDPNVRFDAARLLKNLGRTDEQVINTLVSLLSTKIAHSAEYLLMDLGRTDEQVINTLVSSLSIDDPNLSFKAARLLKDLGRTDEQVINTLVSSLSINDPNVRYDAAIRLMDMGRVDERVADAFISKLSSADDLDDRYDAAVMLEKISKNDNIVVEMVLRRAQLISSEVIEACQRVMNPQTVTEADICLLSEFISWKPKHNNKQRAIREIIFCWLWNRLDPKQRSS